MAEVKHVMPPRKLQYIAHPFGCAARFIGGINNYKNEPAEKLLIDLCVQWPQAAPGRENNLPVDKSMIGPYSSILNCMTGIVFWMEATEAGVLGPGGRLAKLIQENSLGEVFETPEVKNTGHGIGYRNRGFMWVMDKPRLEEWMTKNITEEVKQKIEEEKKAYEEYCKKQRYW